MQRGITFGQPNSCRRRSATNSMYWRMRTQFIPIMLTGSASVRNSCSILTAFEIISVIRSLVGRVSNIFKSQFVILMEKLDYTERINGSPALTQVFEHDARKVTVKSFISGNQFIGEGETRHQPTLLHPEDSSKRAREENPFNSSKSHYSFCVWGTASHPLHSPFSLLANTG